MNELITKIKENKEKYISEIDSILYKLSLKNKTLDTLMEVYMLSTLQGQCEVFGNSTLDVLNEINKIYSINFKVSYDGEFYFKTKSNYILFVKPHRKEIRFNRRFYRPEMQSCSFLDKITGKDKKIHAKKIEDFENRLLEARNEIIDTKIIIDLMSIGYRLYLGGEIDKLVNKRLNGGVL